MKYEYEKPLNVDIKSFPGKIIVRDIDKLQCTKFLVAKGTKGDQGEQGVGVLWVHWISGTHSPGTLDTYRIMLTDGTYTDFEVYNGADSTLTLEYDTCENWESKPTYPTVPGGIYIYTDKYMDEEGRPVPAFKIGTGGQLVNIPFVDTIMQQHLADDERHITQEEREFWNDKERAFSVNNTLVFTKL